MGTGPKPRDRQHWQAGYSTIELRREPSGHEFPLSRCNGYREELRKARLLYNHDMQSELGGATILSYALNLKS
jgi:hypothetical protein